MGGATAGPEQFNSPPLATSTLLNDVVICGYIAAGVHRTQVLALVTRFAPVLANETPEALDLLLQFDHLELASDH